LKVTTLALALALALAPTLVWGNNTHTYTTKHGYAQNNRLPWRGQFLVVYARCSLRLVPMQMLVLVLVLMLVLVQRARF
jgi:hypothetical protein